MDKQLKRLSRTELLELFIEQSQVLEETKEELEKVRAQLEQRRIMEKEAGSIAEAAMRLNGVFEAAQKAADQYLYSIQAKTGQEGADIDGGEVG